MNRRGIILAAISGLVLVVAIVFRLGLFSTEPSLNVHLRCDENVSGKLSVAMVSPNGESGKKENFDLPTVCKAGEIELGDYQREKSLQFIYDRGNGETSKLDSKYDSDIHSDQNGFYLILKISSDSPFIANDQL